MKQNKKISLNALRYVFYAACIACVSGFVSCEDKSDVGLPDYDPSKPVVLTSFSPDSGRIAEKVILTGKNFGSDPDKIRVYFNSKQARVIGSDGSDMYVVCPRLPGEICDISVVIGNDSVVYNQKFRYKISAYVSTVLGNGTPIYKGGTLAEATMRARSMCMDKEDNLFVGLVSDQSFGMIRINEENDEVVSCLFSTSSSTTVSSLSVNLETGVVIAANTSNKSQNYSFDPNESWAPRYFNMIWKEGTPQPTNTYHNALAYCNYDGYIYTYYYNGHIVKIDPETKVAETVFVNPQNDNYGIAFHPKYPHLMYIVFYSGNSAYSNSVCVFDVSQPELGVKKLSGSTSPGHRDGPLEQAQFNAPEQFQFDNDGNLYIADGNNHCIRRVTPENIVETVVGIPGVPGYKDGGKEDALFDHPSGIAVKQDGTVYVSDFNNSRIRKLAIE